MPNLRDKFELLSGAAMLLGNRVLVRAGLRRRADGWRRGAGLVLRGEAATFVLSTFDLDIWSNVGRTSPNDPDAQEHVADRLARFLAGEPTCHVHVLRTTLEDRAEPRAGPSYTLAFHPWVEGPARFLRPHDWAGDDRSPASSRAPLEPGASILPLFNIVCHLDPTNTRADLWLRVNHVGIDGVPVQEILTRLESAWGCVDRVIFPSRDEFAVEHATPRPCDAARPQLMEMQTFLDFSQLLAWRTRQNAELPTKETGPLTFSAALIWCIARHPSFKGIRIGSTVDVPPIDGPKHSNVGRGVGVVVVGPADFLDRPDGLARYARYFNEQMEQTRRRANAGMRSLDAAALLAPRVAHNLLAHALSSSDRAFGSMGLSIIKDAKVFGAPLADVGQLDGFIAIGSVSLPASDGRKVGCVTIKGPASRVIDYPRLIQEAIRPA